MGYRNKKIISTELIYGKVPPQNREIEEQVLAAVMIEPICLPTVLDLIFEDVFYALAHKLIYAAIISLYDARRAIDISTVCEQLQRTEHLETVGGPFAVTKITNSLVSSANVEDHCRTLLEKYMSREMIRIGATAVNDAYENNTDIFQLYDKTDGEILDTQEKVLGGAIKDIKYYAAKVEEEYLAVKQTGVLGIPTKILALNKRIAGLVAPDLIILAARPGAGKTGLALSISHGVSIIDRVPGAIFSLEMDGIQISRRLASIESGIDHDEIRRGTVAPQDELKFYDALDKVGKSPIYIEDNPIINVRTIRTRLTILKRRYKIKYAVVDYIQLMEAVTPSGNREQDISAISRGLKNIAKELQIPIIALSQLSRAVEARADKMPQLSDLRESGAIEQDADSVLFLMRPQYYGFTEPVEIGGVEYDVKGLVIGKLAKNRHGPPENFAMYFNGPCMKFSDHYLDRPSSSNEWRPHSEGF